MKYAPFVLIIALAGQRMVQSIRIHTLELRVDGLRQNVEGLVGLAKTHTETISSLADSVGKVVKADGALLEIVKFKQENDLAGLMQWLERGRVIRPGDLAAPVRYTIKKPV